MLYLCRFYRICEPYIRDISYYPAIKKEWYFATYSIINGPWGDHAKWNKSEEDKYCVASLFWGV